jgi:hypothetical protein
VSDRNIGHGNVLKYKFLFYVVKKQKVSDFYIGHLVVHDSCDLCDETRKPDIDLN